MRLFLNFILPLHWMAFFALMATLLVAGPQGVADTLTLLGAEPPALELVLPTEALAALATGLGVVAALFLWIVVAGAIDSRAAGGGIDDLTGLAFGAATLAVSALFLIASTYAIEGLVPEMAVIVGALAASYCAMRAEKRASPMTLQADGSDPLYAQTKTMAADAAHTAMLTRISGRADGGSR